MTIDNVEAKGMSTEAERATVIDHAFARRCAVQAANAIYALWDKPRGTFWRSSMHRAQGKSRASAHAFFPTVTLRCVDAMFSLFVNAPPNWMSDSHKELLLDRCVPRLVRRHARSMRSTLDAWRRGNELNIFTLCLYVHAFSRIASCSSISSTLATRARDRLQEAVKDLLIHSVLKGSEAGARHIHPFILYHASRALVLSRDHSKSAVVAEKAEERLAWLRDCARVASEDLLAKHRLGSLSPGDSVALGFCAGALALCPAEDDREYIFASLDVCCETQDRSGCWPLGRVIREDKEAEKALLEIPTHEIAWVVGEAVLELVRHRGESLVTGPANTVLQRLIQAGRYAETSIVRLPGNQEPLMGWCSDHPYCQDMIESWTCATVLQSAIHLGQLLEEHNRQAVLKTFTHTSPHDQEWPPWLRWERYVEDGEVDHKHPVLKYLQTHVVHPILNDPQRLPSPKQRGVSILLFGPPGTTKTTIVKAVADGLGWPLVFLSPGNFIVQGLEFIEAQAALVFKGLMQLSRVVILFDECDELFRERNPKAASDQTRGIMAFVTASMLPKLQELHDHGRVLFFFCTNNFDSIDSAVKRGGRIDRIIGVGPPDRRARRKIAKAVIGESPASKKTKYLGGAIDELVARTDGFTRSEVDRAARILLSCSWMSIDQAKTEARALVERFRQALIIKPDDYKKFCAQRATESHAVTEGV